MTLKKKFLLLRTKKARSDFEFIGKIELGDNTYVALVPVDGDEEEYVILKVDTDENGEEYLSTIEDDEEFDKAADAFEDEFMSEIDYDAEADETEKSDDTNK